MPSVISKRLAAAFGLAIALLVGNAIISFRATRTLVENNEKVVHTQMVIETLSEVLSSVKEAETSQRAFLITGRPDERAIYEEVPPRSRQRIERLRALVSDNPDQLERLRLLEQAIEQRLETLQRVAQIRQEAGLEAVLSSGLFGRGQQQMAVVRQVGQEFQDEEDRLLGIRSEQSRISARNTMLTFIAANTLVLGLMAAVYFLMVRDLDERKRAAERLREAHDHLEEKVKERTLELADANTELERSNRELQDFAFVASHDLQEPLRKIQAFGDRLKTKHGPQLTDEAQDYLKRMQGAASRMHTLINDLLTFSRVTTKAQPFIPTDLNQVTADVAGDLEVRVQDTGGRIDVGVLPTIDADAMQMRQLIQNLIGNALKFHKPDEPPIIKIRSEVSRNGDADRDVARITFQDNGIGFDEKYLDRIFTPFQRLHGRGEYEGTGIGLAVCRKIVERHGGTLTAKSRPGEGSTFIVTLPVEQEKEKKLK
jgi:signal transduction histidine kinase